ncbi:MAG: nuclear transport factor 2 family protein [Actinomycetota bacterium]|nr:nuclear transport factor 2 family protein [Actinomycetota bacterium]
MSEQNVGIINKLGEALGVGDLNAVAACFHDDVVVHVVGQGPGAGDHKGVEAFLAVVNDWFERCRGDITFENIFAMANGEWGAEWGRCFLTRTGKTLDTYEATIYRFADGRIAEMWLLDEAAATDRMAPSSPE